MIKLLGALLLAVSGLGAGFALSSGLTVRKRFWDSAVVFSDSLSTALRYRGEDIFTTVNDCARLCGVGICVEKSDRPFESEWLAAVERLKINSADKKLLSEFGCGLGKTDCEGQLSHIELYREKFTARLGEARDEAAAKTKLYRVLGFFAGAGTAVALL